MSEKEMPFIAFEKEQIVVKEKTSLQFYSCETCGSDYLCGINNHYVRGSKEGKYGLPNKTPLKETVPCHVCGTVCKVEEGKEG